jgi:Xaa-Pro dipeptidase
MDPTRCFSSRIERFQSDLSLLGVDYAIIAKPENVFYFSRFNPILNSHPVFVIIPSFGEPTLLVHSLRANHARREAVFPDIQLYGKWGNKTGLSLDPIDAIREIISSEYPLPRRAALESSYLNIALYHRMTEILCLNDIVDVSSLVERLKVVKDELELDFVRKAGNLADRAMNTMIECLRTGSSEAVASTEGQYAMRKLWQEQYGDEEISGFGSSEGGIIDALQCWCLTGGRIAYGCDCPTPIVPVRGDLVLPMVWAKLGGYYAESERTLYVDTMDDFKTSVFSTVLKARELILSMVRPGVSFEELYIAGANIIEDSGLGAYLPGRMGHGIGLSAHEFPSVQKGNTMTLVPGMVFTVEPGLMAEEWGGVRHSDTVIVCESGCELVTTTDRDMLRIAVD